MSCASKQRNKCWSFPHWWLISRWTHRHRADLQNQPHFLPLSHEAGQKEKGYSLAVDDGTPMKWRGTQPPGVCLSVCGGLCLTACFWRVSCFPPRPQDTIQPGPLTGWAVLSQHCGAYLCRSSDQCGELESKRIIYLSRQDALNCFSMSSLVLTHMAPLSLGSYYNSYRYISLRDLQTRFVVVDVVMQQSKFFSILSLLWVFANIEGWSLPNI